MVDTLILPRLAATSTLNYCYSWGDAKDHGVSALNYTQIVWASGHTQTYTELLILCVKETLNNSQCPITPLLHHYLYIIHFSCMDCTLFNVLQKLMN